MEYEYTNLISTEISKIEQSLKKDLNIKLELVGTYQYNNKYNFSLDNIYGRLNVFYSPKKNSFKFSKEVGDIDEYIQEIQTRFEKRNDELIKKQQNDSETEYELEKIKYFYNSLEKYKNENFDFSMLYKLLNSFINKYKLDITINSNNKFSDLENAYKKVLNSKIKR